MKIAGTLTIADDTPYQRATYSFEGEKWITDDLPFGKHTLLIKDPVLPIDPLGEERKLIQQLRDSCSALCLVTDRITPYQKAIADTAIAAADAHLAKPAPPEQP